MIIRIRPLDTFFFRDGKPFSSGQETWADGVFPPSPSILYGALRAIYFTHHPDEFKYANTSDDSTLNLRIKGIFLEIGTQPYLPLPGDCIVTQEGKERLLDVVEGASLSNKKTSQFITTISKEIIKESGNNILVQKIYYQRYLNGEKIDQRHFKSSQDYLQSEPGMAFKKDDTLGTIEEGTLRRAGTQRFKEEEISIIVDFEGLNILQHGLMKLGGEGKVAYYEIVEKNDSTTIKPPKIENNKYFKICLATPALFKQGWLPSWIDETTLGGSLNSLKVKLLTAIVGKPVLIGGFDMKKNRPKPMYKAVPAGSIYYFELSEGNMEEVIKVFHQQAISEIVDTSNSVKLDTAHQGFGITYVAKTQPPKGI